MNPLISLDLKEDTNRVYSIALSRFCESAGISKISNTNIDHILSRYVQNCFMTNGTPGKRQEMCNLLSIIYLMYPNMKSHLGFTRRCLAGWKRTQKPKSATPLDSQLCFAFATEMIRRKWVTFAMVLLPSFSGLLRASEALKLKWTDVAFPGDSSIQAYGPLVAGINIWDAKTSRYSGHLQFVKIKENETIQFLYVLKHFNHSDEAISPNLNMSTYDRHIKQIASVFGLHNQQFSTHSARIGKATEEYIKGTAVNQIAIDGRWQSLNSLRYYVTNGRSKLCLMNMSSQNQMRVKERALQLQSLLQNWTRSSHYEYLKTIFRS